MEKHANNNGSAEDQAENAIADQNVVSTIEEMKKFQQTLQNNPDDVSDDEIEAEFGDEIDPKEIRELFRNSTFGKVAKNPRASARAKLRRRLGWLENALSETETAIEQVFDAPGRTNKRDELENLRKMLKEFRAKTGLSGAGFSQYFEADYEMFERFFNLPPLEKSKRQETGAAGDPNGDHN